MVLKLPQSTVSYTLGLLQEKMLLCGFHVENLSPFPHPFHIYYLKHNMSLDVWRIWEISQNTVSRPNANVPAGVPTAFINMAIKSKSQLTWVCFCQLIYVSSQNVLKAENGAERPSKSVDYKWNSEHRKIFLILQFPSDCITSAFYSSLNMFLTFFDFFATLEKKLFPWQDYLGKLYVHMLYYNVLNWCLDLRLSIIYNCENSREIKQMKRISILQPLISSTDI